jgi:hypothetical protein
MKACVGVDVWVSLFLILARTEFTHEEESLVPMEWEAAFVTDVEKRKSPPYRGSISDPSVVQSVVSRSTDCAIPAPYVSNSKLSIVVSCLSKFI